MNIEVLVRWTEFKAVDTKEDDELNNIINPNYQEENRGVFKAQVHYDFSPMVLDTDDIARYNRSNDPLYTTLRMKDGEGYVIKFPYLEFMNTMIDITGKTVMSCLPQDWELHVDAGAIDIGLDDFSDEVSDEDDLII